MFLTGEVARRNQGDRRYLHNASDPCTMAANVSTRMMTLKPWCRTWHSQNAHAHRYRNTYLLPSVHVESEENPPREEGKTKIAEC